MINFGSLHNQTHYSILDALSSPKDLLSRAKDLGQNFCAITDHGSLAGAWDAYKSSKDIGIKLIIGCENYFVNDVSHKEDKYRHVILLAKNSVGYKNLLTLNKKGYDNGAIFAKKIYPLIDWNLLKQYSEGLICLTACGNGIVSQLLMNKKFQEAEETLLKLHEIFGDNLGIEIQPNNLKRFANVYSDEIDQKFINHQLINLGKKHNIKIVAACNSHYLKKEDHEVHDVLLAIGSHQPVYSNFRIKYSVPDFYLKSGDEVFNFFARNYGEDSAKEWCENSSYFADMCENPDWIDPKYSNPSGKELPVFPVKDEPEYQKFVDWVSQQSDEIKSLDEDKQYLRFKCLEVFKNKCPIGQEAEYLDRLNEELEVIEYHGFSSYMLIVADMLNWARNNGISVGEGRGSAGGSIIAYFLGIHQADPIKYNLIFARFHNKEKKSFPDIDSDIAPSGRDKLQKYIINKYGEDNVAHVSNVNTVTPKVYVRDIARACELGGSRENAVKIGNEVADTIPKEISSIESAYEKCPLFAEYCKRYPEFLKYKDICGKYRAWSTHAGGIIISARPLSGLVPLRKDKDGSIALEYDKEKAEENGLVKMDILGLSTLDTIDLTLKLIEESGKEVPKYIDYDVYDEKAYELIANGDTFTIFQLGTSDGTIDLCKRVKPKNINDLANINALARPSSKDMRDGFIQVRDGKQKMYLLHPKLTRAFGDTYGFGLYEECLMYLAQDVAGWSLHSADRLRKLTKEKGKNPKKAQQWRKEFIEDSVKNGFHEEIAKKIWDEVIELFGSYGFNKSHAVLYSMNGYKTAYLKAHFPVEFLLANLMEQINSNAPDAEEKIQKIKKEIIKHKVKILPPDLNKSQLSYTLIDGNKLLTGLDALKFVGEDAIKDIIEKRPFKNFTDFMSRVDSRKVRANTIQALASVGCLDSFGLSRKLIYLYCSDFRKKLQVWSKKHDVNTEEFVYPFPKEEEWSKQEIYALEKYYLGQAFICKKKDAYGDFFNQQHYTMRDVKKVVKKTNFPSVRAEIVSIFEFKVKKEGSKFYGQTMLKVTLEDMFGEQSTLTVFPDRFEEIKKMEKQVYKNKVAFTPGSVIHFGGVASMYEDKAGIILDNLYEIKSAPTVPSDLKPKKVSLKSKNKIEETSADLFSELEDELINEGLLDFDIDED